MTSMNFLELLGSARDSYVIEARKAAPAAGKPSWKRGLLIAAMLTLALLLVGCTVAYTQGWFTAFFAGRSETPLSPQQIEFIEEKEQVIMAPQTIDGWTIELKSTINDGQTAYIILGVTAPEDIDLSTSGNVQFLPGNGPTNLLFNSENIGISSSHAGWLEDGDGLANTQDYMIHWETISEQSTVSPFSPEVNWKIQIENIVCKYEDTAYWQELLHGKYKNADDFILTEEESNMLYREEIVAEGIWEFSFTFDQSSSGIELLSTPITVKGYTHRYASETKPSYEDITLTSFVLNTFSAHIRHESNALIYFADPYDTQALVIMQDGSEVALTHSHSSTNELVLEVSSPIVLSQADHILLGDGVTIPMP